MIKTIHYSMTQESHLGDYKSRGGKNFEMNKNTKILNLHVNEKKCIHV